MLITSHFHNVYVSECVWVNKMEMCLKYYVWLSYAYKSLYFHTLIYSYYFQVSVKLPRYLVELPSNELVFEAVKKMSHFDFQNSINFPF